MKEGAKTACFLCGDPAQITCVHCDLVHACGDDHLTVHRPENICFPFKVIQKENVGRIMVATRDIHPLELILYDHTQAFGPKNSTLVCLECLASNPKDSCFECGWPMCKKCKNKRLHHSLEECKILSSNIKKKEFVSDCSYKDYISCVAPLRLLLLKKSNPSMYQRLQYLMDHNEDRKRDTESWDHYALHINKFIRTECGEESFTDEEIYRATGILWTNAFSCSNGNGQAVFPTFSFISHSCASNCDHVVFPNRHLVLQAKVFIEKEQELTINYISSIQGRLKRRQKLRDKWFFNCACERCSDPTELGSHMSSHLCQLCGNVSIPEFPLDIASDYLCSDKHSTGYLEILKWENEMVLKIKSIDEKDLKEFNKALKDYSKRVHRTNYILILLKRHIIALLEDQNDVDGLNEKIALCDEVLNSTSKIDPGFNRDRGMILKILSESQKKLDKRLLLSGAINEEEFSSRVEICMRNFNESNECLSMRIKKG